MIKFSFEPCKLINKFPCDWKKSTPLKEVFCFALVFPLSATFPEGANPKTTPGCLIFLWLSTIYLQISTLYWEEQRWHCWEIWFSQLFLEFAVFILDYIIHYFMLYIISHYILFHITHCCCPVSNSVSNFFNSMNDKCQTLSSTISWICSVHVHWVNDAV